MKADAATIKKRLVEHYDQTSRAYHQDNYLHAGDYSPLRYRQHYVEEMIATLRLPPEARILDVGCGPGELVMSLLKQGYRVRGIDISQGMVDEANRTVREHGFSDRGMIGVGDIEHLDFESVFFDVVVAAGVIEYQKQDDAALAEMNRVLKPGGHLILNVTNRYAYSTLFETPYRWLKRRNGARSVLASFKRSIATKDLNDAPDRRTHSPRAFDRTLAEFGFRKVRHNFFHFSPLPVPFDSVFSFVSRPVGRRMESLTNGPLGILGGGYLVMARKESAPRATTSH
jgi:ubiquinone/menaquinone biosynthesis C-methylase UbiE